MEPSATLYEGLLDTRPMREATAATRRWKIAAALSGGVVVFLGIAAASLVHERAELQLQLQQQQARAQNFGPSAAIRTAQARTATFAATAPSTATDTCTAAGKDVFENNAGARLPCCDGLVIVNSPCRTNEICQFCVATSSVGDACTVAGTDVFDNNVSPKTKQPLKCCPGLKEVPTPCRGTDTCMYCQAASAAPAPLPTKGKDCTPGGVDMYASGAKKECCPGLTETTAPVPAPLYVGHFCIPLTHTDGPRAEYPPAKISIDPLTPKSAADKHKDKGMSLIWSDEFKDMARTKAMFVFEDIP